jgi:hypothetical protein
MARNRDNASRARSYVDDGAQLLATDLTRQTAAERGNSFELFFDNCRRANVALFGLTYVRLAAVVAVSATFIQDYNQGSLRCRNH